MVVETKIWALGGSFFLRDIIIYLILHLVFLMRVSISVQKDQPYHFKPKSNFYLPSYHEMLPQWTVSLYHTGQYLWARSCANLSTCTVSLSPPSGAGIVIPKSHRGKSRLTRDPAPGHSAHSGIAPTVGLRGSSVHMLTHSCPKVTCAFTIQSPRPVVPKTT